MSVFGGVFLVLLLYHAGTCARIRMHAVPKLRELDRWTEKRSMFGVYDNIGILGEQPRLALWLKRPRKCFSKRMLTEDKHSLDKRISFLYRRFNRYGKHR
uniref:Large ribosomal subunit protein mL51 n=1 Tax=Sinocyclocheilus anshuiensis TaxID=1608454 RepID=A0A671RBZ6_9TELE